MNTYIVVALVFATARLTHSWSVDIKFLDAYLEQKTNTTSSFMNKQLDEMEKALNVNIDNLIPMKDYVESVKKSSRKVAYSYPPTEEPGALMENPDVSLSVPAIVTRNGYTCETHTVLSQGYFINVHRIPYSRTGRKISNKTILLHHGTFGSSDDWILNGPGKALGYVLADAGYDVWMSNTRGNKYSKEHRYLKSDSKSFWNFSWHDVASHDVPAVIDHILKVKGENTTINYIGHSMGTTILFAMLTLRPEYNAILKSGIAIAPVAFLSDLMSPIKSLAPMVSDVAYMEMLYGSYEFILKDSVLNKLINPCYVELGYLKCTFFEFEIYKDNLLDRDRLSEFLSNQGTGTSWKTVVHFAQEIMAGGNFQQFDYGSKDNQRVYGSDKPPNYDLSKITLPITLFWVENDMLSSEKDVNLLLAKLPPLTKIYKVPDPEWTLFPYAGLNEEVINTLHRVYTTA